MKLKIYIILALFFGKIGTMHATDFVVISEILYDTPLNEDLSQTPHCFGEFIELYNAGTEPVNLTGWQLGTQTPVQSYSFSGVVLAPHSFLTVAFGAPDSYGGYVPEEYKAIGWTDFHWLFDIAPGTGTILFQTQMTLPNDSCTVMLKDNTGKIRDYIRYDENSIWPSMKAKNEDFSDMNYLDYHNLNSIQRSNALFDWEGCAVFHESNWVGGVGLYVRDPRFALNSCMRSDVSININIVSGEPISAPISNYIVTVTPTVEMDAIPTINNKMKLTDLDALINIDYFDGLGRPIQTVQKGITPLGKDLVSYTEYDGVGRAYKQWLPVPMENNQGAYVPLNAFVSTATSQVLYSSDTRPFAETLYKASPLNRVAGQKGPGVAWDTHSKSISYQTNADEVTCFFVNSGNQLEHKGNYDPNTLYKTLTADEDGKTSTEYNDKQGQIVMKQSSSNVNTYYVYNDLGQLCYVLPPIASDSLAKDGPINDNDGVLKRYSYLYKYDERGNCIYKRLPGCSPIYMVYDKADRMVLTQDGNQRKQLPGASAQWTVTKYDALGRAIFTGLMYRSEVDSMQNYKSIRDVLSNDVVTDSYAGFTSATPLIKSYYDNYNFLSSSPSTLAYQIVSGYDKAYPVTAIQFSDLNATGLLTGTRTYFLDGSGSNTTTMYYDERGRVVQTRATNHLGGYDISYNALDFTGKVTKTLKEHSISSTLNSPMPELYTYTYDYAHGGRLLTTKYELNHKPAVILASNTKYDELGRLKEKQRHTGSDIEEFDYNIRNWATRIKSGTFEEKLYYNTNLPENSTPCYNGNIAANTWTYNGQTNGYIYYYDQLNRLGSNYSILNNVFQVDYQYSESFNYDKQGNIHNLYRYDNQDITDQLTLTYTGNQVTNVKDDGTSQHLYNIKEYQDKANNGNNTSVKEFKYDQNGNMTTDLDRDIVTIRYNILNLPNLIQFRNGNQIINKYDASGRKLSTRYVTIYYYLPVPLNNGEILTTGCDVNADDNVTVSGDDYVGNVEYSYFRGFDYDITYAPAEGWAIKRVQNPEGYASSLSVNYGPLYSYYRKDHLGNNREVWQAAYTKNGVVKAALTSQCTQYYPSGLPWASNSTDYPETQPYKYNGKEFVEMHGWDCTDLGWRWDYNAIFRFTSLDRKSEKYPWQSPYCVAANNPVRYNDKNGENPLAIPIVAGLTVLDLVLIGTGVVTAGILWEKGTNDRIQLKQDVKNAVSDFLYKDNPGKNEQDKREKNGKIGLDQNQANVATAIKENTPNPQPDGSSDPKGELKGVGKTILKTVAVVAIAEQMSNPNPSKDAHEAQEDKTGKSQQESQKQPSNKQEQKPQVQNQKPTWQLY